MFSLYEIQCEIEIEIPTVVQAMKALPCVVSILKEERKQNI